MDLTTYLDPDIMARIQTWGYVLMFLLMIIEWPIVVFISAFLSSLGVFNIWYVIFLGFSGDIIGDLIFYTFWYITRRHTKMDTLIKKWLIGTIQNMLQENLLRSLIVIKYTPYLPPIGLSMVGAMHMPIRKYLVTTIGLSIIWPFIFGISGYYLGLINELLPKTTTWITMLIFIVLFFLMGVYSFYNWFTKRYANKLLIHAEEWWL